MKDYTHTLSVGKRDTCSSIKGAIIPLPDIPYCTQSVCINTILNNLHANLLRGDSHCMKEINRYVSTCSFLNDCGTNKTNSTPSNDSINITLKCMCGDDSHDLCIRKRSFVHQLPNLLITKNNLKQPRIVLDLQSFIPCLDTSLCYENLPDVCSYMQFVLQKRFLDRHSKTKLNKSEKKTIQCNLREKQRVLLSIWRHKTLNEYVSNILIRVLHDSIPCLKNSKRTRQSIETNENEHRSHLMACINIMHGTLLKLYPMGIKTPPFTTKVNIVSRINHIMNASNDEQLQFIHDHPALIKLCMMEYVVNVLTDFLPCEHDYIMSYENMLTYKTTCVTMCDTFRQEIIMSGNEPWDVMNRGAASGIEKCMRVCKFKMMRYKYFERDTACIEFHEESLRMKYAFDDMYTLNTVYSSSDLAVRTCAHMVQSMIKCFPLPYETMQLQTNRLRQLYGFCDTQCTAVQTFTVCSMCVMNGRTAAAKMRMCPFSGKLSCVTCPPGSYYRI
jgi:hypothetical protein